jgi:hypothetical protein
MIYTTRLIAFLFLIIIISMFIKKFNIQEGLWVWNIPTRETIPIYDLRGHPKPKSTNIKHKHKIIKHIYIPNQPYQPYYDPFYFNSYYNPYHNPYYNPYYNSFYNNSIDIDLDNHFRTYYPQYYYSNTPRYLEYKY